MATALVTGASSGIGLEIAHVLAADHEVVLAARSADKLGALAAELDSARVIAVDLADPSGTRKLVSELADVDVLVNNAGFGDWGLFTDTPETKLEEMMELNVGTLTRLTRAYLPGMLARGAGRVMNIASTAAFLPGPLMAVYYATKAYVLSFSEALAEETRGTGVTVTALCPGPTASGFQAGAAMEDSRLVKDRKLQSRGRRRGVRRESDATGRCRRGTGPGKQADGRVDPRLPRPVVRRMVHRMQAAK